MKMIPNKPKPRYDGVVLQGELEVFEKLSKAFSHAGDDYIAFHSITLPKHPKKRWSESDFVIVCPSGIFTLEVKGGDLKVDENSDWYSLKIGKTDRPIENPWEQSHGAMQALYNDLIDNEILKTMNDGDAFHIVELNLEFCKTVEATVLKQFREENPNIEVVMHNAPIEKAELEGQFEAIICGLPFNNFQIDLVQHLFTVMLGFLRTGCELAYFEYLGVRGLKRVFGFPGVRKETINRTTDIKTRYATQQGTHVTVWRNLPSCRVVRLRV